MKAFPPGQDSDAILRSIAHGFQLQEGMVRYGPWANLPGK